MSADSQMQFRNAILRGESVETEFGEFAVRSYRRYEGRNPRTGEPVIVPASHTLFLKPSDNLLNEVLGSYRRPLRSIERDRKPFISFAADYAAIVAQLRGTKITAVPDSESWAETVPVDPIVWRDLGWFAVFRGPDQDEPSVRTAIAFRQSDALAEALRAALGE